MIALISIIALALLGLLWWWVVQPRGESTRASREIPLPLYTTRTPGRGVSVVVPTLARGAEPATAGVAASTDAPTPPVERPAVRAPAPPVREEAEPATPQGVPAGAPTFERVFTTVPWVEPEAASAAGATSRTEPAPSQRAAANGRAHAEAAAASDGAATAGVPSPTFRAPRSNGRRVAPRVEGAAPPVTPPLSVVTTEEARWGPPPERDPAGTVQFLPGRLEVLQGRSMEGQEIRFVRPDRAGERAVVTFGRSEGVPYRHVRLNVPTVSRLHARMALEPGADQWTLENLSSTNPVAVNGADLAAGDPPLALADGDRVEMGEIVFVFRAR